KASPRERRRQAAASHRSAVRRLSRRGRHRALRRRLRSREAAMSVLVTGGAGYIGSHMTYALIERGESVGVLDNLSTGSRSLVSEKAALVEGEVADKKLVAHLIKEHGVDAVIHFAGSIVVPESVAHPLAYYANNTVASRLLMEACVEGGVKSFIFSST